MTGMLVSAGASSVAHGVHYTVLGIGMLGLVVLLAPPRTPARHRATAAPDEHARRVAALRRSADAGTLATAPGDVGLLEWPSPEAAHTAFAPRLWLPLAVVSTAAAAAVHAAVGPAHLREQALLGVFFVVSSIVQLGWSLGMVVQGSAVLLRFGAGLNVGLAVLWLVTRTVGLPSPLPGVEPAGPWDLACVVWEVIAAVACLRALGAAGTSYRLSPWTDWDRRARMLAFASVVGLGLLSISGAGA